jgi:hypothetical protein
MYKPLTGLTYSGLAPHKFTPMPGVHKKIEATGNKLAGFFQKLVAPAPHLSRWIARMELLPLILFNEKVDRLERCRLTERLKDPHFSLQPERALNREWIAFDNVSEDDVVSTVFSN